LDENVGKIWRRWEAVGGKTQEKQYFSYSVLRAIFSLNFNYWLFTMAVSIVSLESKITTFSFAGWVCVTGALIPLGYAGYVVFFKNQFWQEAELGSFIGGVAGTFAALAGVFFVFVAFLGQRVQILLQQQELELNRKELQETRIEIRGQKEQLELQNEQIKLTAFQNVLFNLIDNYKEKKLELILQDKHNRNHLTFFNKNFYSECEVLQKSKPNEKLLLEDLFTAFSKIMQNYESTLSSYYRSVLLITSYCIDNNRGNSLKILEMYLSEEELVFHFYFGVYKGHYNGKSILASTQFISSINKELLYNKNHYEIAYNLSSI
jgi:hypothetical protein